MPLYNEVQVFGTDLALSRCSSLHHEIREKHESNRGGIPTRSATHVITPKGLSHLAVREGFLSPLRERFPATRGMTQSFAKNDYFLHLVAFLADAYKGSRFGITPPRFPSVQKATR